MNFFRRKKRGETPAQNENEGTHSMSNLDPSVTANTEPGAPTAPDVSNETVATESTISATAVPAGGGVAQIRDDVIAVLKTVYDPEIPVDIYELGLIYEVEVGEARDVSVIMTLTTPMCPVAETLPPEVEAKVRDVPGVQDVRLELVWEPPWSMDMMSEAARLELNL